MNLKAGVLFLIPVLALIGCGDDATSTAKFTAASGTITAATVTANKTAIIDGAKLSFSSPTGLPTGDGTRDLDSCTTKTPADTATTDADSDGISTQTRTYACTNVTDSRDNVSVNGTATTTDKDDADPKGGFRFEYDIAGSYSSRGGETFTYKGFWDLTKSATSFIYTSDYSGVFSNSRASTGYYGGTWATTITPTDMANPYSAGGALEYAGFLAYKLTEGSGTTNFVFTLSSTGLTYGAGICPNFYSGGSYTFTDASANAIKVTFTDCNTVSVTYNGDAA